MTQTTTIGAIARIGIVWLATMYGRKPRVRRREWTSTIPIAKPTTAPSANPTAASFAVKSDLWKRIVPSAGWFTWAGCQSACRITQMCGIDVSLAANGCVQPVEPQIHR